MFIVLLKQMLCHKHRQQSWLILRKKKYFDNFIKKNKNENLYLVQFCTFPFFFFFFLCLSEKISERFVYTIKEYPWFCSLVRFYLYCINSILWMHFNKYFSLFMWCTRKTIFSACLASFANSISILTAYSSNCLMAVIFLFYFSIKEIHFSYFPSKSLSFYIYCTLLPFPYVSTHMLVFFRKTFQPTFFLPSYLLPF